MSGARRRVVARAWWPAAAATGVSVGIPGALAAGRVGLPTVLGFLLGAGAGSSAVLLLPSIPTRIATATMLFTGGFALIRYGSGPGVDTRPVLLWAVVTLVALVATESARGEEVVPLDERGRRSLAREARAFTAFLAAVLACGSLLAALQASSLDSGVAYGDQPSPGDWQESAPSVLSYDRVDLRGRPRLSDAVVFTVKSAAPDFWRAATFDVWDGVAWTRSDDRLDPVGWRDEGSALPPVPYDVAAATGEAMEQTVTVEAPVMESLFAAPTPVEVRSRHLVGVRPDGTAAFLEPLGRGATYTVTSRRAFATETTLRAATRSAPSEVLARYASPPETTERVRRLAFAVTAGAPTVYDKVRALERWLGANTRYSLDAPSSPDGVDAVDHFLFASRLGWCEQVASSLTVMLRSVGIPARFTTGFVTGERHPVSGRYVVRERDAHAWVEVYFPGVGWQGFDPTASVPLAGEAPRPRSAAWSMALVALALGSVMVVGGSAGPLARRLRGWAGRRGPRHGRAWAAGALARLDRIGSRAGRARRAGETPVEFGRALARLLGTPELEDVGAVIDRDAFSGSGATRAERESADAVLAARARRRPRATVVRP